MHVPKPLSVAPAGDLAPLVTAAKQRRLVLYTGAGISMGSPSLGPTGPQVAERLRPYVSRILEVSEEELKPCTLEDLSQKVLDDEASRMDELRTRAAATFDFAGMEPNYGHEACALLMREGLARVISVNWDRGFERAGTAIGTTISAVANDRDAVQLGGGLAVYKVHGCATRPETLAMTQDEVDRPQTWAVARTQDALGNGVVVFVGLGTLGLYVKEPLPDLVSTWTSGAQTVRIVDPSLSDAWAGALGDRAAESHVALAADEFFDELLRALVLDALDSTEQAASTLAAHDTWAASMVAGMTKLRQAFSAATADGILRWWRDGVTETQDGTAFVTGQDGQNALLTVAHLAERDGGEVTASGARSTQTVATPARYFEIHCRPGQHISDVREIAESRVEMRRRECTYDARTVTIVVANARGVFPAAGAPVDIAADPAAGPDIGTGAAAPSIEIVSAEDGVHGRL